MKSTVFIIAAVAVLVLMPSTATAQVNNVEPQVNDVEPYSLTPAKAVSLGDEYVEVSGVWGVNGHVQSDHQLNISHILCNHRERTCDESLSIAMFDLYSTEFRAASIHYTVERWTKNEIVAGSVEGVCLIRYELKIDRDGYIFASQRFSEPMSTEPRCNRNMPDIPDFHGQLYNYSFVRFHHR